MALELLQHDLGITRLEGFEQDAMLLDGLLEAAETFVAVEVGADPRPDRALELDGVRLH